MTRYPALVGMLAAGAALAACSDSTTQPANRTYSYEDPSHSATCARVESLVADGRPVASVRGAEAVPLADGLASPAASIVAPTGRTGIQTISPSQAVVANGEPRVPTVVVVATVRRSLDDTLEAARSAAKASRYSFGVATSRATNGTLDDFDAVYSTATVLGRITTVQCTGEPTRLVYEQARRDPDAGLPSGLTIPSGLASVPSLPAPETVAFPTPVTSTGTPPAVPALPTGPVVTAP